MTSFINEARKMRAMILAQQAPSYIRLHNLDLLDIEYENIKNRLMIRLFLGPELVMKSSVGKSHVIKYSRTGFYGYHTIAMRTLFLRRLNINEGSILSLEPRGDKNDKLHLVIDGIPITYRLINSRYRIPISERMCLDILNTILDKFIVPCEERTSDEEVELRQKRICEDWSYFFIIMNRLIKGTLMGKMEAEFPLVRMFGKK
jgi:hypothetical protein